MIYYLAPRGRSGIENYIVGGWRPSEYPEIQPVSYEDVFLYDKLPSGTWIFVGLEQLTPAGQRLAETIWQTLSDAGQSTLNRPKLLPTRHDLLEIMCDAGINQFRSHMLDKLDANLRFPVFVRQADDHTGSMSGLLSNRSELKSFLRWQRVRGYDPRDLLVIEFCDTANEIGEYRKYSAQYVEGEVAAQYVMVGSHWMTKFHGSFDSFQAEWADEEREFIKQNEHRSEVKRIFELAKIDFGRIDYGLLNRQIQVWEINTNPSIGGPPPHIKVEKTPEEIESLQMPGRRIFFERFQAMLATIDTLHDPNITIELKLSDKDIRVWRDELQARQKQQKRRESIAEFAEWPAVKLARDMAKKAIGVKSV